MNKSFKMLGLVAVLGSTLAACSTAGENLMNGGATPYTRGELYSMLSGKTHVWATGGGTYYMDSGVVENMAADGTRSAGTWSSATGGSLCWHEEEAADDAVADCQTYYHDGDATVVVRDGAAGPDSVLLKGNMLDAVSFTAPAEEMMEEPAS